MAPDAPPLVAPWRRVAFPPAFGGSWTLAADLDGDGAVELVTARNVNHWAPVERHHTCTVSAWSLDGTQRWWWGGPGAGRGELHHDVACQIHDWEGEGRPQVVVADERHVVVLDGATGAERRRFSIPRGATDCLVFCDLAGRGARRDLLVKDRYEHIYAFGPDGALLWELERPGGDRTCHQPLPLDLDGDGREEILVGRCLAGPDGALRWRLEDPALDGGHLDCARVVRRGARPEEWRLAFTYCSAEVLGLADGTGRVLWTLPGEHYESLDVGRVLPGEAEPQIVVDIDKGDWGAGPLRVVDLAGTVRAEWRVNRSRQHDLVDWRGDGLLAVPVAEGPALYDGGGRPLARLGVEPQDRPRAVFAMPLTGEGRMDLLLTTWYGTAAYLYRNPMPGTAPADAPLGSGVNFSLY